MRKHCAQLAQLVEQRTENPCVSGSIPELGILIYYGILAQVVEHLTFNQVVRGSNPRCLIRKKPSLVSGGFLFLLIYGELNSGQHILISKTAQKIIKKLCMFVNTFRGQGDTIITVKTPQYIIYFLLSP